MYKLVSKLAKPYPKRVSSVEFGTTSFQHVGAVKVRPIRSNKIAYDIIQDAIKRNMAKKW